MGPCFADAGALDGLGHKRDPNYGVALDFPRSRPYPYPVECGVCGGKDIREDVYTARDDDEKRLVPVPALKCQICGSILPDAKKIQSMPELRIPSSVRMRCAKIRAGE